MKVKKMKKCRGVGNDSCRIIKFDDDSNCNSSSSSSISLFYDNDNMLCEILSRLPAKTLMRFKCICKHWQFLIQQDPYFIYLHHSRSKLARPSLLFVGSNDHFVSARSEFYYLPIDLVFEEDGAASAIAHTSSNNLFSNDHIMLGPVNGLICFHNYFAIRIYNLSTREVTPWINIPIKKKEKDEDEPPAFEFGFDPATKEHKVICVRKIPGKTRKEFPNTNKCQKIVRICEVLTAGDTSWRRIDEVPPYGLEGISVYANGYIYWRMLKRHELCPPRTWNTSADEEPDIILAFDVGSEKFRVIYIPDFIVVQPPKCDVPYIFCVDLIQVDGSLGLLHRMSDRTVKLWIFDDDDGEKNTGTSNNWIEETITLPFCWNESRDLTFQAVAGTDQIIVYSRRQSNFISLHSYDRKIKTFKNVEISGISVQTLWPYRIATFVESLLPVQKQLQLHHGSQPTSCT